MEKVDGRQPCAGCLHPLNVHGPPFRKGMACAMSGCDCLTFSAPPQESPK